MLYVTATYWWTPTVSNRPSLTSTALLRAAVNNYHNYNGPRTNNHVEGWHSQLKRISFIFELAREGSKMLDQYAG